MERLFKNLTDDELIDYMPRCENYNDSGIADEKLQELNSDVQNKIGSQSINSGAYLNMTTREIYREAALRWQKQIERFVEVIKGE